MLGVVGSNLTIFKLEPTTPSMSQQGGQMRATCMLRPTMLRHVALACCDRLAGVNGERYIVLFVLLGNCNVWSFSLINLSLNE